MLLYRAYNGWLMFIKSENHVLSIYQKNDSRFGIESTIENSEAEKGRESESFECHLWVNQFLLLIIDNCWAGFTAKEENYGISKQPDNFTPFAFFICGSLSFTRFYFLLSLALSFSGENWELERIKTMSMFDRCSSNDFHALGRWLSIISFAFDYGYYYVFIERLLFLNT